MTDGGDQAGGGAPRPRRGRKVRVDFRKNRGHVARDKRAWTRGYRDEPDQVADAESRQSLRGKGGLSRKRTIIVDEEGAGGGSGVRLDGRVAAVRGLAVDVYAADGVLRRCFVRKVLQKRLISGRNRLVVGDRVRIEPAPHAAAAAPASESAAVVVEVLPRTTTLTRRYGQRLHVIAANVDQAILVFATQDPPLRPHLIDRLLLAAHQGGLRPIICINKIDVPVPEDTREAVFAIRDRYRALGYTVLRTSATLGTGLPALRDVMRDQINVMVGVSGVGKSSLLNALQPGLGLRVAALGESSRRGRHTTTTAELLPLDIGGYVVDTPGMRQYELADVEAGEVEAYFPEFVALVAQCRFPGCTHLHEEGCAIRAAVDAGRVHPERYASYARIVTQRIDEDAGE